MSNLSTLPKGDSAWLLRKAIERIIDQVSVLETNIGVSTSGNSADTQIIFNDNGTLRGDAGLVYNKTTDALTIAGLVTAGSATITGAATVGTTLGVTSDLTVGTSPFALKVFPATNRVLINQAAAIQGDSLELTAKTNGGAISLFGRASDNLATIAFRSNGAATQKASIQGSDAGLEFVAGATTKQSIDSSTGNVTVSLGNLVMGTSGKGIDFSATANGSGTMTSELLNDYEEGTFTATLTGSTTNPTIPVTSTGRYTKIGREVKVSLFFINVSTLGASGSVRVTGLPFTSANDGVGAWGVFTTHQAATFTGYAVAELGPNTASMEFPWFQSAGVSGYSTHNAGTGRYIGATLMYNV